MYLCVFFLCFFFFFYKQKTAYDMRISDWSSDVCSSDLSLSAPPCVAGWSVSGSVTTLVLSTPRSIARLRSIVVFSSPAAATVCVTWEPPTPASTCMSRLSPPLPVTLWLVLSWALDVTVMPLLYTSLLAFGASRVQLLGRLHTPGFRLMVLVAAEEG